MFRRGLPKRVLLPSTSASTTASIIPSSSSLSVRYIHSIRNRANGLSVQSSTAVRSLSSWGRKDDDLSPRQIITEIRNRKDHAFTIKAISRGWSDKTLPYDDIFLKEYIKAAVATNRIDALDLTGLITEFRDNASQRVGSSAMGGVMSAGNTELNPIHVVNVPPKGYWASYFLKIAITVTLFAGAYYYLLVDEKPGSQPGSSGGGAGGIAGRLTGSMKNNLHIAENPDKSFKDVVGVDEAKAELQEIVMYLKEPQRFTRLGGKLPKGVLLTGPPGTGKTLLAKAIAGEAGVPFFYTSGSEFEEMFVGVGAKRVRDMFEAAKAKAPCIIFIDEIDAIGGSRHLKDQSTMKMTLNQLLVEMDGFESNNGVVVIAATNFPDSLDNALTRPGRLDKHVDVPLPDIGGRTAILQLYGSKVPLGKDVDMEQLSRGTPGFSGADLFNLVNQAALKSSVNGMTSISMASLEYAKDKIMMGAERQSAIISEETVKCTAYHEAGHAVVAHLTAGSEPIHKATVMPRGRALGMVMQLPEGDQTSMTKRQMLARMDVCMGGRVAEEIIFGPDEVTSGASSDIQQATRLAQAMVTKFGMSDKVGMIYIDEQNGGAAAGKEVALEVKELLSSSYARTKVLLEAHRDQLEAVAKGLIEFESLSGSEIVDLINGKKITAEHHKRSQKPSRDIVPIKNRNRPNQSSTPPPTGRDGGDAAAAPPRRVVIRRPVPAAPSSANIVKSEEGTKRTWGSANVAADNNSHAAEIKQPAPAATPEATDALGWSNTFKGWFGYGDKDLSPSEGDEPPVDVVKKNAQIEKMQPLAESGPTVKRRPILVGPPTEKIPESAVKSAAHANSSPSGVSAKSVSGEKSESEKVAAEKQAGPVVAKKQDTVASVTEADVKRNGSNKDQ